MTLSVAHLSDPHLTTGPLAAEPAAGLYRALGRVLALDPRPDCVVVTGDLADHGHPEEYAALRDLLDGFPLPLYLLPGNHDEPAAFLDTFAGGPYLAEAKQAHYAAERPELTVVALDSHAPGTPAGRLGGAQLDWLERVLASRPGIPALVCVHHPPVAVGIPYLDGMRLADGAELGQVLARHQRVVRVLAGHVHRPVTAAFAGTTLAVAPSTYRQSELGLRADRAMGYLHEPTGFLLHLRAGAHWITHTVPVSHAAALTVGF